MKKLLTLYIIGALLGCGGGGGGGGDVTSTTSTTTTTTSGVAISTAVIGGASQ